MFFFWYCISQDSTKWNLTRRVQPRDKTIRGARHSPNDILSRIPLRTIPFSQDSGSLLRRVTHPLCADDGLTTRQEKETFTLLCCQVSVKLGLKTQGESVRSIRTDRPSDHRGSRGLTNLVNLEGQSKLRVSTLSSSLDLKKPLGWEVKHIRQKCSSLDNGFRHVRHHWLPHHQMYYLVWVAPTCTLTLLLINVATVHPWCAHSESSNDLWVFVLLYFKHHRVQTHSNWTAIHF